MIFNIIDPCIQDEPTSKVLRIMMLSRLILDCDQIDTKRFAPIQRNAAASLFAAQPVCSLVRQQVVGNSGSTGLSGGESPNPPRT